MSACVREPNRVYSISASNTCHWVSKINTNYLNHIYYILESKLNSLRGIDSMFPFSLIGEYCGSSTGRCTRTQFESIIVTLIRIDESVNRSPPMTSTPRHGQSKTRILRHLPRNEQFSVRFLLPDFIMRSRTV